MKTAGLFLDESRRLRTVWRFLIFGVSLAAVWLTIGLIVAAAFAVCLEKTGRALDLQALLHELEEGDLWLSAVALLPAAIGTFVVVWVCRRLLDRRSLSSLGLGKPDRRLSASIWFGMAAAALLCTLSVAILVALGRLRFDGTGGSALTVVLIPALVVCAFHEELIFRGYLLQNMLDIRRPVWGVLFSSVVFSLMHSLNPGVWTSILPPLNLFLAGVVLALAYMVSGNLWFPSAMHFMWNFCQGAVFGIPVSGMSVDGWLSFARVGAGDDMISGGAFGLEGSVVLVLLQGAAIAVLLVILHRQRCALSIKVSWR
jgi:membrane protease YdiL (CAAX protease family)